MNVAIAHKTLKKSKNEGDIDSEVNDKHYDVPTVCAASDRLSIAGASGCRTKFPSLGGVERVMNSIIVGSLSAACRKAVKGVEFR